MTRGDATMFPVKNFFRTRLVVVRVSKHRSQVRQFNFYFHAAQSNKPQVASQ